MSKKIILILLTFILSGCGYLGSNRFFKSTTPWFYFYFGEYSGDFDKECRKQDGIKPYNNGVQPSRTCGSYQRYLCRINITCKKYQDLEERRRCELEANDYWLPDWQNAHNDPIKKIQISQKVCEAQRSKCNSSPKNDKSCLK